MAFTSPVSGAATWAKSNSLKYAVTLNLSDDPQLANTLQAAVDNAVQINGTKFVQLNLRAPSNGSLEARITYDYIKLETPVEIISLIDRPDDGGGTLTASWTLVHDDDFSRYLIYLNEGPFGSVSVDDLAGRTVDKAISLHSRLQSEVTSANGQPLVEVLTITVLLSWNMTMEDSAHHLHKSVRHRQQTKYHYRQFGLVLVLMKVARMVI